jgi:hypothetical protein
VVWPNVVAQYSAPDVHWTLQAIEPMTTDDVICEMVGDLARIIEYPALGYQAPIDIPMSVQEAFRVLVDAGYTAHLPRGGHSTGAATISSAKAWPIRPP